MDIVERTQASATHEYHSSDKSKRWLSYSQLASYLSCKWKWHARYVIRLQDNKPKRPMALGDAVHRGIASLLMGQGTKQGLDEWEAEARATIPEDFLFDADGNNIVDEIRQSAENLINRIVEDLRQRNWHVLVMPGGQRAVELELSVPMPGLEQRFDGYAAHIDAIIHDKTEGTNWIVDWKNRGTLQNDASEEVNLQNAMYQLVAMANGIEIAGTITYQILNKTPVKPKMNKDGSMSRTKIATDWATYEAALIENGLDPLDYLDMRAKLDTEWLRPIRAYRSQEELLYIWNKIVIPAAHEIMNDVPVLRNMAYFNCLNCDVRQICLASLRGHDVMEWVRPYQFDETALHSSMEKGIV